MALTKAGILHTYQWASSSPIRHVDIRESAKSGAVVYIYAPADGHEEKLLALKNMLIEKGWAASPDLHHEESVLRVTGIGSKEDLLNLLQAQGFTEGAPATSRAARDTPKSFTEKIRQHSLRLSGLVYTLGNALYVVSGFARGKDVGQIGTGLAFASGDVAVSVFGGKDDERQFKSLMTKLAKHLDKNGITIPKDSGFAAEISTRGEGVGEKTYDYVHEHINKIKALAEVAGGIAYFKAGKDQGNRWKQATAVIFSLGFGSSLFIKEKKRNKEALAHAGPLAKAWAFVEEKPLRIAGWSGLSNTLFTTIGAFKERKAQMLLPPGKQLSAYKWDLTTAGTMLVANNLYALSNKSTGGTITTGGLVDDLYGLTAQVLNNVPEAKREAAIKAAADFLGERIEIHDTRREAEVKLREHMTHAAEDNVWFKERARDTRALTTIADAYAHAPEGKTGSWAHYVSQPETTASTPAI